MKITYTPNPLETIVELDEHEIEVLRLKLKIEAYEDMIFSAHWNLTRDAEYLAKLPRPKTVEESREEAIKELDPSYWCDDDSKLDKRVEELLQHYLAELKSNHVGDCTCFAMSCSKCHAESMLGIDTIKGLGKHPGHKIESVFSRWNPETKQHDKPEVSLDEAISRLENYNPTKGPAWSGYSQEAFDAHVPRWKAEGAAALNWLKNYRDEHFT